MNIRRRTTEGFILDFPLLNVFGFTCYVSQSPSLPRNPVQAGPSIFAQVSTNPNRKETRGYPTVWESARDSASSSRISWDVG
jgi:hypothetical protein